MQINNLNSIAPPILKKGDQIEIVATARFVSEEIIKNTIETIKSYGFNAKCNIDFPENKDIFSDSKINRRNALQHALNSDVNKAVFFARGGYGTIQLIDDIDFSILETQSKWLVGFSDITMILIHVLQLYNISSIHGPMPFNYSSTKTQHIIQLFNILKGERNSIFVDSNPQNIKGVSKGKLVGGNLSIIYSLIGSESLLNISNQSILFIEDVDEYLYHIERMMYSLKRSGLLKKINGLIVGSMKDIKDNELQFGKNIYQIIKNICKDYSYPICFSFPAGHTKDNHPLIIGTDVILSVNNKHSRIDYII
jgi:muramoyltetrapeptide carboxypeptidase